MKSLMITNQMKSFPPRWGAQCILSSSSMKNSVFCHTHFSFIHPSNIHLSTRDKEINQSQSLTIKKLKSSSVLARSEVSKRQPTYSDFIAVGPAGYFRKFYWNIVKPFVYVSSSTALGSTMAELSSCNRDPMANEPKILLASPLKEVSQPQGQLTIFFRKVIMFLRKKKGK